MLRQKYGSTAMLGAGQFSRGASRSIERRAIRLGSRELAAEISRFLSEVDSLANEFMLAHRGKKEVPAVAFNRFLSRWNQAARKIQTLLDEAA